MRTREQERQHQAKLTRYHRRRKRARNRWRRREGDWLREAGQAAKRGRRRARQRIMLDRAVSAMLMPIAIVGAAWAARRWRSRMTAHRGR